MSARSGSGGSPVWCVGVCVGGGGGGDNKGTLLLTGELLKSSSPGNGARSHRQCALDAQNITSE